MQVVGPNVLLSAWTGLGGTTTLGFSGVEQIGGQIFAVAVMSGPTTASRERLPASMRRQANCWGMIDGDLVAARWEDLAFDGRYLYAADLRGNADGFGPNGDIYVFDITGPGGTAGVPEPALLAVWLLLGLAGVGGAKWRRRRSA